MQKKISGIPSNLFGKYFINKNNRKLHLKGIICGYCFILYKKILGYGKLHRPQ